uniref:Reverse transcriptase domain-containing protein n=1 Tax=Cyprinus carpio carpio TaxID=630221 RepID=A0A9J7YVU8_CYPCA
MIHGLLTSMAPQTAALVLGSPVLYSALHLPGFQLFRADRDAESSGKSRVGGTCFNINERWCTDVTVLKKMCCSDLEVLFVNCKLFYSPREFHSFILVSVYIPPQAQVSLALQKLADQITETEQQHPDSVLIILGDFNKANFSRELPKYRQHVTCPTRDSNILDHCYTTIKDAYHSVPRAALGLSDHCLVHLIPTYRQKLKSAKPVVKTVKRWTNETEQDLKACFDLTDWSVFEAATTNLDELTETVTSYISFCEDICIPTRTYLTFNNDKPWFTAKLRHLRQAKEDAYRNGDRVLYNQARNTLNKEIRAAKRTYSKKLEDQFTSNDSTSVWKGLRAITNYKTPSPCTEANQRLANDLNEFYCRFETPHIHSDHLSTQPLTPPTIPLSTPPALQISENDVCQVFRKNKRRKAPGPDGVTPACLRTCADQLAPIFSQIFNRSLELCEVPSCFKRSTIIPVPKKPKIIGLNDYRPVGLTSVVMKSFEKLVLAYMKDITGPLLDPLQFAYRANRSVDDAINLGLHFIMQHLDKTGTYVRILFVDFSSAFNTIIPTALQTKLTQLSVPSSICQWITSFLTDRQQLLRLGKFMSNSCSTNTGAPHGCVLSPLLFSLYTSDCTSKDPSVKLLKFADDTTVIGLIQDGDESPYRQEVEQLAVWSSLNNLELNTLKTVEMIVDFRRNPPALPPLTIMNSTVAAVESFRFLGTTISQDLKWDNHIDSIVKKAQQRLYFLRQLRKFNLPQELLKQFYSAVIESVLCTSITVWFGSATKSDIRILQRTVRTAEIIIDTPLPTLQELYTSRVRKRAQKITLDPSHPSYPLFELLPSGRRFRAANTRTVRHKNSFFPQAIYLMNS